MGTKQPARIKAFLKRWKEYLFSKREDPHALALRQLADIRFQNE